MVSIKKQSILPYKELFFLIKYLPGVSINLSLIYERRMVLLNIVKGNQYLVFLSYVHFVSYSLQNLKLQIVMSQHVPEFITNILTLE